ncbi:MAG: bifunctional methylenetetrahydrofolate dehydrogenase/methenyltetrahydrofolate cyclohydrolase FolD [Thermodesulfobacteriota bacterium]
MSANIISGKDIATDVRNEIRREVGELVVKTGTRPGLAVVLMGDNPASKVYVRNKTRACEEVGIKSFQHDLPADAPPDKLLGLVRDLNGNADVHGILVQLPLPGQINELEVIEAIDPAKDVDGFHPFNVGRLMIGRPALRPCTPYGIMRLLDSAGVEIAGTNAVVIGRSNIVGKPMAMMLLQRNATVTVCHSKTADLPGVVRSAEIVVAAVGRARFIQGDWVREGAVVIDVGMNRDEDGRLCGDVDFKAVSERASHITPVPGGVGPMTIAMLLKNTVQAARDILAKADA